MRCISWTPCRTGEGSGGATKKSLSMRAKELNG
nr:MAG TPA: hypothetical protein [Caudoviricetes sp.]